MIEKNDIKGYIWSDYLSYIYSPYLPIIKTPTISGYKSLVDQILDELKLINKLLKDKVNE